MRDFAYERYQPKTADEALREQFTNQDLLYLLRICSPMKLPPTRKDDLLALLLKLLDTGHIQSTLERLTPRQLTMVAETAWSDTGIFDSVRFDAKYPPEPASSASAKGEVESSGYGNYYDYRKSYDLTTLFMPHGVMAQEIQHRLRTYIPKPAPPILATLETPPEHAEIPYCRWNAKKKNYDRGTEPVPITIGLTELPALHDLMALLRLVEAGKIAVSDKNRYPNPASLRQISTVLEGGDFFSGLTIPADEYQTDPGPIRAFAWPLLLQAGKLAEVQGSRLVLTKGGRAALTAPPQQTLRTLWNQWIHNTLFDELRRIEAIRGQTGRGQKVLTKPESRRLAIVETLRFCPVRRWFSVDEFARYLLATDHDFAVARDLWPLYISDPNYGSLAQAGNTWRLVELRYALCFFMEYAGTLGLVDVGYAPPSCARLDYGSAWGTDDMDCMSRYDGLYFLQLNTLGEYCLDLASVYLPPKAPPRQVLDVRPNLNVLALEPLMAADRMLLETFATSIDKDAWHLSEERILEAVAQGRDLQELTDFLQSASGSELPDLVAGFLAEISGRVHALRDGGAVRLIRCATPELAAKLAGDSNLARYCRLIPPDSLLFENRHSGALARAFRSLGYILPSPTE